MLGVIQRFFATEVVPLGVHPDVRPTTVDERAVHREQAMARYFERGELHRFRVKPTVFMPALPPLFELEQLHRLLVGLSDGAGGTTGLGYLEHISEEDALRLISPVAEGPKALKTGVRPSRGAVQRQARGPAEPVRVGVAPAGTPRAPEERNGVPSLIKKRRKKMRKKKHKKLLKRTRWQRRQQGR